jgi:hypothetical protein
MSSGGRRPEGAGATELRASLSSEALAKEEGSREANRFEIQEKIERRSPGKGLPGYGKVIFQCQLDINVMI